MGTFTVHIRKYSKERPGRLPACDEAVRPALPRKRGAQPFAIDLISLFFSVIIIFSGSSIDVIVKSNFF